MMIEDSDSDDEGTYINRSFVSTSNPMPTYSSNAFQNISMPTLTTQREVKKAVLEADNESCSTFSDDVSEGCDPAQLMHVIR